MFVLIISWLKLIREKDSFPEINKKGHRRIPFSSGIGLIFINDWTGNSTGSVVIFAVRENYSMLFTPFPRTGNTSQMILFFHSKLVCSLVF